MKYSEKLQDVRWQRKRLEILHRDDFLCACCRNKIMTELLGRSASLQVHHLKYIPRLAPWDHPDSVLITLCKICHEWAADNNPFGFMGGINRYVLKMLDDTKRDMDRYRQFYPNDELQYWIDNPTKFSNGQVRAAKVILRERTVNMNLLELKLSYLEDVPNGIDHYWNTEEKVSYYSFG